MKTRKIAATLPAVLIAVALAWPATALAQDPEAAYKAGYQALQQGNYRACVDQFRSALKAGGEAYERWDWLHLSLGICLGQTSQRDEAISELQMAKDLATEDNMRFEVNHNLAQVYVARANSGDYDRAIAAENEASKYAANAAQRALVSKTLGQAYYFKEDWRNAIQHLGAAAEARSTDSDVAQKLGRAYFEVDDLTNAMQWFQKTLQLDRDNNAATTNIGRIHLQNGNWSEAARYLQQAVNADPQNMQLRSFLGRAHLGAKSYPQAIRELEQVTASSSANGSAWYNLGQAYQAAGQNAKAIDAYTGSLRFLAAGSTARAEALYDLGFVYEAVERYDDALQALEDSAAIEAQPKTTEAITRVKERIKRQKEGGAA